MNTKKIHNPKSNAPAVYIPCWLIQVSVRLLSSNAKILYGRLCQWSNESGTVFRSAPQLAEEIGTSTRQIEHHLKELRDVGLIGTFQPQAGGLNHFRFYDHEWMHEPINKHLAYKIPPPDKTKNPPTDLSVPPDRFVGTPPTDLSGINKKEIKENTTTTRAHILNSHPHSEPVVVSSTSLTSTPKVKPHLQAIEEGGVFISPEWDSKLRAAYNKRPPKTKNIFCDDDFLSACKHHADNRPDGVPLMGRLNKLIEFTLSGAFEEPQDWAANIVKARNHRAAEENLKRNEANSEARIKQILKKSTLNLVGGRDTLRELSLNLKKESAKEPSYAEKRSIKKIELPIKHDEVIETDFMWHE
ncbi:helix-turn-helix domain-containing protein [Thiocapsa sp. N5-Cardenillas]|uniref:helix-turn-helix domain-containing protein n=1 Tax=Thiocapsa sp. N5-Cardenillas TaxID=3137397 RepID=UPI0035B1834C